MLQSQISVQWKLRSLLFMPGFVHIQMYSITPTKVLRKYNCDDQASR